MTTAQAQPRTSEWGSDRVDLDAYLRRITYDGPLTTSIDTLRGLHRAHAATIPFENLDILLGRPIPLDIDSLQDKLVRRPRGGYCYEHNLLFTAVLDRLGYRVTPLGARVRMGSDKLQPRSHALLRVRADGEDWLADVGFGGEGILEPIALVPGTTARQSGWTYRLDREPGGVWVLRSLHPDRWFDLYSFTGEPHHHVDYGVYNHSASTSPSSPFVNRVVVQRTGEQARHTLVGRDLTTTRPGGERTLRRVTDDELAGVLAATFGIVMEPGEVARLP
ncbi:MAG: arylamine N-acetyltransferase family protein [Egibacteraceae bacterium]